MQIQKKELDFGVFYTCFTEYEAVEYSLDLLYSIYKDIPVYLISDGGSDYSNLSNKFKCGKFLLEHDSRGMVPKINEKNWTNPEMQKIMIDSIFTFLERVKRAIEYSKKPYLLIMEPDVLVRGKLHIKENTHLAGSRVNPYHWAKDKINEILSGIPGSVEVTHYGATPAILKSDSFMNVYDFFKNNTSYVNEFCKIDPNFSNYDILLTVLFAALGYNEIENDELTECLRNTNWENSGHPLLHQFRIHYPKSNYTGRHQVS
jgi:hypothetical protein